MNPIIFLLLALVVIFLCDAIWPHEMWRTFAAWKYKHPAANEPSSAAYAFRSISSLAAAIFCAAAFVYLIRMPDRKWPAKPLSPAQKAKFKKEEDRAVEEFFKSDRHRTSKPKK